MRPLFVIGLVIVAVAVLLFALFSVGGDTGPATPAGGIAAPEDPAPVNPNPDTARQPDPVRTAEQPGDERRTASAGDQRTSVATTREVFDNAIVGVVTDPEGQPVEGVRITLTEGGLQAGMAEIQRIIGKPADLDQKTRNTTTNEEGRYRFRNLEPGDYSLVAKHEEFSQHQDPMLPVPLKGELAWNVQLREGLLLTGYVRDSEGQIIEGATVTMSSSMVPALFAPSGSREIDEGEIARTDEAGYYQFLNVTPGQSWHISASAPGYGTSTKRNLRLAQKNGAHLIDFKLEPGVAVKGRVYAPDRTPVAGALIRLIGYQQPQTLSANATSDANGRFAIEGLVPGGYALIVEAEGWGIERRNHITAPTDDLEVEMTEQGAIMGRVIGIEGVAVTDFRLSLHEYIPQTSAFGKAVAEKRFQDPEGSFKLTGVEEGLYAVKVAAAGYAESYSEDFEVTQGLTTTDVIVRMSRGGSISGQVLDATTGEPVAGATVLTQDNNFQDNPLMRIFRTTIPRRTSDQKARTDKDGRFTIEMLAPEMYQVQIKHPSFPDLVVNNLRVIDGDTTDMGAVRMQPGSTVRGTVYDSAGSPLVGATVQLTSTTAGQMRSYEARSDSSGRFLLRNVPEGDYRLAATRPTTDENPFQAIVDMKNSEVLFKIGRGQEYTQDLNLGG